MYVCFYIFLTGKVTNIPELAMVCDKPELKDNIDKGMQRQNKIIHLINDWYKEVAKTTPPPPYDPTVLYFHNAFSYYHTKDTQNKSHIATLVTDGLNSAMTGLTGVTIDASNVINVVSAALAHTTKHETSQGFSTFVLQSFKGTYNDKDCLYKPMVVAMSFNFSPLEYKTDKNVAAFGYFIYLLCTERPPGDDPIISVDEDGLLQLKSIDGEDLNYELPPDMSIVGKKYMTLRELDQHR